MNKKIFCLIVIIFSLCVLFSKDANKISLENNNKDEQSVSKNIKDIKKNKKSPKEKQLEKRYSLKDFVDKHNDNFVCAMDYYNELSSIIKNNSYYPMSEIKTENKELFMISIVFPEMMRYSEFRDKIETRVTSVLYSCGSESLSCSIGYMQMKPLFASSIERVISIKPELKKRYNMFPDEGADQTYNQRHDRIIRLQSLDYQIIYLCAFIDIAMEKYNLQDKDIKYQLKILSTAYNSGLIYRIEDIEVLSKKKAFPNGSMSAVSLWNYSDLVSDFYDYVTNGFCFK